MSLLSIFAFTVFAASSVISPIPDDIPVITPDPPKPDVSFGQIVTAPTPLAEPDPSSQDTPQPSPASWRATVGTAKKQSYTIAFLGDSMIDTMSPGLPAVNNKLSSAYPATNFTLLNYGVGGTNLDDAIRRISSFASVAPDIVVLESCAYNPYPSEIGVDRHWLALAKAVDMLRSLIPGVQIVVAATIAPNSTAFGDGAPGIAFSTQDKIERTTVIREYLDNTVKFAASQNLPLADVYHASLTASGDGNLAYINGGDHIHYSDAGRNLFAKKVADAISANHLLE